MKTQYEIINHGCTSSDYFQGCGTYGSGFEHVVTGIGNNAKEAYEDAIEQACQSFNDGELPRFPVKPRGINKKDAVPANAEDVYWYVSIRFNTKQAA